MDMAKKEELDQEHKVEHDAADDAALPRCICFWPLSYPDLILGIQSVEENEVIDAEIEVVEETPQSKLDKVTEILVPKTEPQPVPAPSPEPLPLVERDDFFD